VALRVKHVRVSGARVRHGDKGPELIVTDSGLGEFAVDDKFTFFVHSPSLGTLAFCSSQSLRTATVSGP
jgi:hypothetical protein